jgi:hypothetical protein
MTPPDAKRGAGQEPGGTARPRFIATRATSIEQLSMTTKIQKPAHKLGANRKELARKRRKHDANFAQSRDIREDRGERQMKAARARQTFPHLTRGR